MDNNEPKFSTPVKVFSRVIPKTMMPKVEHNAEPAQFVECHLQPVPKTFKLYSFEVEGGLGCFADPNGLLPSFNWVEHSD